MPYIWKHENFHHTTKIKEETHREKWGCLNCNKTPGHYGIKSQPSSTELDQIDHLSRECSGACRRRTHVVSQGKMPACNAVQYRAQYAAISAHWRACLSPSEPRSRQMSSVHPSETFALHWNAEIIRLTGEFRSCPQMQMTELTDNDVFYQVTGCFMCS